MTELRHVTLSLALAAALIAGLALTVAGVQKIQEPAPIVFPPTTSECVVTTSIGVGRLPVSRADCTKTYTQ